MYQSIKSNLEKAADVSKDYFDKKAHKCNMNVNDLVLLINMLKANKIQPTSLDHLSLRIPPTLTEM
uniref:Uncharacterized protein n=1 Tax=Romanomermis culicivorax TaxID=13658 RepID=A0A915K500_ROMCU